MGNPNSRGRSVPVAQSVLISQAWVHMQAEKKAAQEKKRAESKKSADEKKLTEAAQHPMMPFPAPVAQNIQVAPTATKVYETKPTAIQYHLDQKHLGWLVFSDDKLKLNFKIHTTSFSPTGRASHTWLKGLEGGELVKLLTGRWVDFQFLLDENLGVVPGAVNTLQALGEDIVGLFTKLNVGICYKEDAKVPRNLDITSPTFKMFSELTELMNEQMTPQQINVKLDSFVALEPETSAQMSSRSSTGSKESRCFV